MMMRNLCVTALAVLTGAAILVSCRRDFDSPYMPGSPGYAGDEWTHDEDGNGVADSLDKYSPTCQSPPKACLENAKVISRISSQRNTLIARDILLWVGDSAQAPNLEWTPVEGALRGYVLNSSDSVKVRIRNGRLLPVSAGSAQISVTVPGADICLLPVSAGSAQISVTVPGADSLFASFIAKVVSGGTRVQSVSAKDITVSVGRDTVADVDWTPADADFRDYFLISDLPLVARIVDGQTIRGVFPGKANVTLTAMDGSRKTAFSVIVSDGPQVVYTGSLTAETMYLVKGGMEETPKLHWSPANVTDKIYKLVPVDSRYVTVTGDSLQVIPLEAGTATVLAKALDGSGKATEITVVVAEEAVPVAGILATYMNLIQGADPVPPRLTWVPADATNRKYSLTSADQGVALVSSGMVLPVSMGTSVFTVTTEEGGFTADFTVTVGRPDTTIHVDSVKVAAISMPIGSPRKPTVSWYPADAGNQAFTLSSDDTTVVAPEGEQLSSRKVGSANVRLTTVDGGRTADFKVTVYPTVIPVTLIGADSMSLTVGQEMPPTVTWTPAGATNQTYTLTTLDTNTVAIVNSTLVYAKSVGSARVTIKSADGPSGTFQVVVNATTIKLASMSAANFTMNVGDIPRDAAIGFAPSNASNKSVILASPSGTSVISVNDQNRVVAVAPGKALLTAVSVENSDITASCSVTVVALAKSITAKNDTMRLGQADRSVSTLLTWDPPNVTDKRFALTTKDTNVVKPSGMSYKAMGGGTATVTASALDGSGKSATFTVLVKVPVTAVIAKDITLNVGDPIYNTTPLMSFQPAAASDKNWFLDYTNAAASPAPSSIVKILNGWQFQALAPGAARITVFSNDNPAVKDTFTVTIVQPVTGITVTGLAMKVGDPDREPVITWNPANATNKNYTLASANTAVVSIVANKLHAVAAGSANVTVTSADGGKADTMLVTVTQPVTSIAVAGITVKRPDGDKDPIITWTPSNASNKGYTLSGGIAGVATVVGNKIHPVGVGNATMTVTTTDGAKTANFTVTVQVPVEGIHGNDLSMFESSPDIPPEISFTPADAGNKGYTLTSLDTDVVTIVNGMIRARNRGTASVIVTSSENGAITDTFQVTVTRFGF